MSARSWEPSRLGLFGPLQPLNQHADKVKRDLSGAAARHESIYGNDRRLGQNRRGGLLELADNRFQHSNRHPGVRRRQKPTCRHAGQAGSHLFGAQMTARSGAPGSFARQVTVSYLHARLNHLVDERSRPFDQSHSLSHGSRWAARPVRQPRFSEMEVQALRRRLRCRKS
jgi:hypothetical protein